MERRIHGDVGAVAGPTGLMPRYDDLRDLFKEVLGSSYSIEDYQRQFCLKIPQELARIERVKGCLSQAPGMPAVVFYMLEGQRRRLVRWQHQVGDLVPPFDLEQATIA